MLKKELEDKVIELNSRIFDLEQALFQSQQFEEIGDEKLVKCYQKFDKLLVKYKKNDKDVTKQEKK